MNKTECYFQFALARLQRQDHINRDLETKAARSLSGAVAILGAAYVALRFPAGLPHPLASPAVPLLGGLFVLAAACSLLVLLPRKWHDGPSLQVFADSLPQFEDAVLVEWAGDQCTQSVYRNNRILLFKSWALRAAIGLLLVMALLVFLLASHLPSGF